ncbi:alpha-L-fucosidase [Labilibacter sediminis]|nr:alpha-L-fucosidase [Labilibacter sediminis]
MKNRYVLLFIGILFSVIVVAQERKYESNWESLDSRDCPQWFPDAKFGIFIHWGLYSVPGYTNKGTYAEWYWNALLEDPNTSSEKRKERHHAITKFHNSTYGEDFKYSDFREGFSCELFNPEEWADIFKRSGAKYVVLTSKHHDGYCLWPNKEASESYGMAWNSVESGPKRDLVGDLTVAVRNEGLKMGLYYSIWDWFNPLWTKEQQKLMSSGNMAVNFNEKADMAAPVKKKELKEAKQGLSNYVHKVMYPQFKEIVNKYEPSLLFSDGDWWMNDELWETKPLLAWLYNNAPNKDEVVINDRWGKGRGKHGGYYTTEYGSGFEGIDKPWEENRGIGMSFGVNRIENIDDYRTEKELLFMLADLVSRGGNLLLNIGPNPDGTIPVIMQQRLVEIGNWLNVNGEAIYGTRAYKESAQWSEGKRPVFTKHDFHAGFPIFEMTIDPKPGNAYKEAWFTKKGQDLYALTPGWPKDNQLTIRNVELSKEGTVEMLGVAKLLNYTIEGNNIHIDLSNIGINDLPCNHIYTIKISNIK